jgi:hypothetical protein
MKLSIKSYCLVAIGAMVAISVAQAEPSVQDGNARQCFLSRDWRGWRAADNHTMYIRVGMRDIYRLDLAGPYPGLLSGGGVLVHRTRGSGSICSALDLDLRVSRGRGSSTHIFVKSMTKLSPEDAAALPRHLRP